MTNVPDGVVRFMTPDWGLSALLTRGVCLGKVGRISVEEKVEESRETSVKGVWDRVKSTICTIDFPHRTHGSPETAIREDAITHSATRTHAILDLPAARHVLAQGLYVLMHDLHVSFRDIVVLVRREGSGRGVSGTAPGVDLLTLWRSHWS